MEDMKTVTTEDMKLLTSEDMFKLRGDVLRAMNNIRNIGYRIGLYQQATERLEIVEKTLKDIWFDLEETLGVQSMLGEASATDATMTFVWDAVDIVGKALLRIKDAKKEAGKADHDARKAMVDWFDGEGWLG